MPYFNQLYFLCIQYAADVVACNRDPNTDDVETLDAWNSAIARRVTIDQTRDVMRFASNYNNGRISCRYIYYCYVII